jgi:hypothetical protein
MAHIDSHLPFELDARDPDFARQCLLWSSQTRCEIQEVIASTKHTIAISRALIAEADRLLAWH